MRDFERRGKALGGRGWAAGWAVLAMAPASISMALAQGDEAASYDAIAVGDQAPAPLPRRADDLAELEEVVVLGEKLGRTLAKTTSSVAITNNRAATDYGIDSVSEVIARTANASITNEGDFSLRGVSAGGAEGFGAGQPVISTYLDGVAVDQVGQSGNLLDLFDVEQVEVLRGAQSTSQGRNALAGAVVVNTREPTQDWNLVTRMRLAELNERQYAAAGGGPIGGGLAFRLAADYHADDGFVRNVTLDDPDWNRTEDLLLRGKLAWRPSFAEGFDALLTAGKSDRDGLTQPVNRIPDDADGNSRTVADNVPRDAGQTSVPISLRLRQLLGEHVELSSTTGLIRSRNHEFADYDTSTADNGSYQFDQNGRTLTQELRLNVRDWNGLTGLVGLYAGRFRYDSSNQGRDLYVQLGEVLPVPAVGDLIAARVDFDLDSKNDADNVAVFTEFDYQFTERLTSIGGLRYDREHAEIYSNYQITRADGFVVAPEQAAPLDALLAQITVPALFAFQTGGLTPGTGSGRQIKASYDALLPKIGLRYALTPEVNLFLTYVEAYRAGGGDVDTQNGDIVQYDPEYTHTVETGLRTAWFDRRLQTRGNVYYTKWTDQQVQVPNADGSALLTQNAADSTLYGVELENSLRLGAASSVYLNAGYAHARFDRYETGSNDYSGNRFAKAPEWTGSAGGVARFVDGWLRGWFGSIAYTYTGTSYTTPANTTRERGDAHGLLDLRLGYETSRVSIVAFGRNLLDDDYATYRASYVGGFGIEAGRAIAFGSPRVFGVQVDMSFE
ncbi:TonB-dependent receptor [Hydrocarboniphaga effusa]|uniref:TonB-dependent receptor n=1 Tax=Hydrocarboniphaga effusa TaxID=243629 RepID=UPI00398C119C